MNFTLSILGTEVFSISTDQPAESHGGEHDSNCSQTELSYDTRIGFHIPANPSLNEGLDPL